jgi:hypothetical protein
MKNYHDGLINSMHALALSQLQNILKKKNNANDEKAITTVSIKNSNIIGEVDLSLNYYNLGVQQEYMRRKNDCEISYNLSNKYCETDNIKLKKKLNLGSTDILKTTCSTKFGGFNKNGDKNLIK